MDTTIKHTSKSSSLLLLALLLITVAFVSTNMPSCNFGVGGGSVAAIEATTIVAATATTAAGLSYTYEVITDDLEVDWSGGGNFDPKDKCPEDFITAGFKVVYKKMADGAVFQFLYHSGKKILYRIDVDNIRGIRQIGLHWVQNTKFGSKYRIFDKSFKGGKTLDVPTGTTTSQKVTYQYGEAVSGKKVKPGRELFDPTHIPVQNCPDWWDIFNFLP